MFKMRKDVVRMNEKHVMLKKNVIFIDRRFSLASNKHHRIDTHPNLLFSLIRYTLEFFMREKK